MADPEWEKLKDCFHTALALPPNERPAYLERVCGGDASLRQSIEALLKSHEESGFVDEPAYAAAAQLIVDDQQVKRHSETKAFQSGHNIGRYRIDSLLGEGGMGRVYLAEDTKLRRKVSLKFLSHAVTLDHERLLRFEQEARAASALNHPNILTIYEFGEDEHQQFIATEFVEGQTLRERLQRPIELDDALDIAIQITSALVAAHRVNIVHRDIKPDNIIIRKDDRLVKILDFGLAKILTPATTNNGEAPTRYKTGPGVVMGTVAYMSPEQARGDGVDERSDIWSLGVVLYEMITGSTPFVADTANEIISGILSRQPAPPLTRFTHDVPERLQEIVDKLLMKDRDERYQTSKDLLIELKRLKESPGVKVSLDPSYAPAGVQVDTRSADSASERVAASGYPTSSAEYIINQVRRHKRGLIVMAAICLLAAVTAAIVYGLRSKRVAVQDQLEVRSLAVLPLKSLDSGENYLGLAIADAVIRRISQTGQLIVRPTSAVRRYSNEETDALSAAKQLGVDSVLEGTVQRAQDRFRVSVNLLRVGDGSSLWADSFDMRSSDIFTIQDTISQQVASRLQLKLNAVEKERLGKRYTSNAEAYEYFVKGQTNFERVSIANGDREPTETAISYWKKAVELDPNYALAYATLGQAYMWMANFNDPDNPVWVRLSQEALAQAESLDPQLAEIHEARFQYYFSKYGNWDLAKAAREAGEALKLNPNYGGGHSDLGTMYDHLGLDEAVGLRENQRWVDIDPTNTFAQARLIESYELYGKFDEALDMQKRFFGTVGPPQSLIAKGRLDEAQPLLEATIKKNSGDLRARARLALLFALRGSFAEAEAAVTPILEQARNNRGYHHITYDIACVYALDHKTEEAVRWLRTTVDNGMPNYSLFFRDPNLDRIRKEPLFIQFMTDLKPRWESYRSEFSQVPE